MLNTKLAPEEVRAVEFADVLLHELQYVRLRRSYVDSAVEDSDRLNPLCSTCDLEAHRLGTVEETLKKIQERREALSSNDPAPLDARTLLDRYDEARKQARKEALVGLAFSGGGIRSATFNLGILQGLASLGLLSRFDYLSTVSGGGYIGSWLSAWLKREGDPRNVEIQLHPSHAIQSASRRLLRKGAIVDEEPEPVYHLRAHSNYLTPKLGIVSADTWTLVAIYFRNLLLNLFFLVPLALSAVLLVHGALNLFIRLQSWGEVWLMIVALLVAIFAFLALGARIRPKLKRSDDVHETARESHRRTGGLHRGFYLPLLIAAILYAAGAPYRAGAFSAAIGTGWLSVVPVWVLLCLAMGAGFASLRAAIYRPGGEDRRFGRWLLWRTGLASGTTTTALAVLVTLIAPKVPPFVVMTLLPAAFMVLIAIGIAIEIGMLGSRLPEGGREWWASVTGRMLLYGTGWVGFLSVVFLVPLGLLALLDLTNDSALVEPAAVIAWLGTAIAGALAGKAKETDGGGPRHVEYLGFVAPWVFLIGLCGLLSLLTLTAISAEPRPDRSHVDWFLASLSPKAPHYAIEYLLHILWISTALVFLAGYSVNVNLFSLHALYANRLTRCYLGASRAKLRWKARDWTSQENATNIYATIDDWGPGRGGAPTGVVRACQRPVCPFSQAPYRRENALTGFDTGDDFPLRELVIGSTESGNPYWGPLLLLNTAMNLVAGEELAWQERKAESFILSPLFCGSKSTGYRLVTMAADEELTLGRAMAVSGAAASPNMGYHTSPPLTALMTVFNVRLGWWMRNPSVSAVWDAGSPPYGRWLLHEMLGQTDDNCPFVYLSDGGHFDNLGVYELVRRRCQYIVACDASADPTHAFVDLASLIRKCRTDFGIRIEIDLNPLRRDNASGLSRWHCSVGSIRYDDVDRTHTPGVLVYLKTSVTGDETSDVLEYKQRHTMFPHQTTVDQFFSESQFECYRALGYHVVRDVFEPVVEGAGDVPTSAIFSGLRRQWFPPPPDLDEHFLRSVGGFSHVHEQLRTDPLLRRLAQELYAELAEASDFNPEPGAIQQAAEVFQRAVEVPPEQEAAELHMVAEILQVMENAWLELKLDNYSDHPTTRGWMNVFRRWTNSDIVNRHWALLRGEYSHGFVRFCEQQLKLVIYQLAPLRRMPTDDAAYARLCQDYNLEWYQDEDRDRGLERRLAAVDKNGNPLTWIIWNTPACLPSNRRRHPIGLITVLKPFDELRRCGRHELLVWLRGPYRNLRVGQAMLDFPVDLHSDTVGGVSAFHMADGRARPRDRQTTLFDFIRSELSAPEDGAPQLFVRYGRFGIVGSDSMLERSMWSSFFHRYGFSRPSGAEIADFVLTRH